MPWRARCARGTTWPTSGCVTSCARLRDVLSFAERRARARPLVVRFKNRQRAAGTRRVHQPERVRSPAGCREGRAERLRRKRLAPQDAAVAAGKALDDAAARLREAA